MKNIILKSAGILTVLLLATGISSFVSAQQTNVRFRTGERPMMANQVEKLKLTEDQQKQMAELRAKFQEETLNVKNLIGEKMAHIKTLLDMENRDVNDLDKTIDMLSNLKGELMKKGIAHRDAVKKILTPEQMKIWDFKAKQHIKGMMEEPGQPGMMRGAGMQMRGRGMQMGGRGMQMGGRGMQMMGTLREADEKEVEVNGKEVEVEGKEIEAEGKPANIERKVIIIDGKPMKVKNTNIKEEKTKKKSEKNEKEDR